MQPNISTNGIPSPFKSGAIYTALADFDNGRYSFSKGQHLRHLKSGYIAYDREYKYLFEDILTGKQAEFWIRDDAPIDSWHRFLQEI